MKYILFILLFSIPAFALNCNFWTLGFPDPARRFSTIDCQRAPNPTPLGMELYYLSTLSTHPQLSNILSDISESLIASNTLYSSHFSIPNIKVIIDDSPKYDDTTTITTFAFAYIQLATGRESCPIVVYPSALTFNREHLKQLVAHELFHCVQKRNFESQTNLAAANESLAWAMEGSAQFMSNLVYPSANLEYHPMFGQFDFGFNLYSQAFPENIYTTVYFFQSLHNTSGSINTVIDIFRNTPSDSNWANALNSISGIKENFHEFNTKIVDRKLRDSSGSIAPTPRYEKSPLTVSNAETQVINLLVSPFTVTAYELSIPKRGIYDFSLPNRPDIKVSIRKDSEENYSTFPYHLESSCSEDEKLVVIISNVSNSPLIQEVPLTINRRDKEDCGCEITARPNHSCLFGTFELDHQSMRDFFQRTFGHMPNMQFDGSSGSFQVTLDREGNLTWNLSGFTLRASSTNRGMTMRIAQISNGTTTSRYQNNGQTRMCAQNLSSSISCTQTFEANGRTATSTCMSPIPPLSGEFSYECHGNTLIYTGPGNGSYTFNYHFQRIR